MISLLKEAKFMSGMNAQAAGVTTINGNGIDTAGFDGVCFVAHIGTLTAGQVTFMKVQMSNDNGVADAYADYGGTGGKCGPMADGDSNKCLVLDVFQPTKRWVRPVIVRGTQNAVIDSVVTILYRAMKQAPVQPTSDVSASLQLASPAAGTVS